MNTGITLEDFEYWMKVLEKSQSIDNFSSMSSNQHTTAASLDC